MMKRKFVCRGHGARARIPWHEGVEIGGRGARLRWGGGRGLVLGLRGARRGCPGVRS